MYKKIFVWLTTVYMLFAGLFCFGSRKPKPDLPTQADYVEVLEALKEAFATGEYQALNLLTMSSPGGPYCWRA